MSTPKQKQIEVDEETLKMWYENTGREPFVSAYRSLKAHQKAGRQCKIVWRSSKVMSVTPIRPEEEPVAVRQRRIPLAAPAESIDGEQATAETPVFRTRTRPNA